jgi:Helicase C-terminal domain
LIEAKLEFLQERGADPFTECSLPEAILKLRQRVGRLIRTKSDRAHHRYFGQSERDETLWSGVFAGAAETSGRDGLTPV